MKLRKFGLLITLVIVAMACKKKYKNPDPAPEEFVYTSSGKVNNQDVAFLSGVNGYYPSTLFYTEDNVVSYKFGIKTANTSEDYFEFFVADVAAGPDSNDVNDLLNAVANKSYVLGEDNANPITYSFSYFRNGVQYAPKKGQSGNIVLSNQKDLGEIKAIDHKTGEEYMSRYVQFNGKLENVTLYNAADEALLITKFEFLGKLAAAGDLRKKK
ncbi:MAG TPA: hypothetical protein VL947_04870 [Cytophagales bacterium]|nr:hypothetical protein [Cytophagales bacterium]